jgi:hypothetical protein
MYQSFPCRYGSNPQEKKSVFFGRFLGVLVAAQTTRKKCLGQHNFFSLDLVKINYIPVKLVHSCTSKKSFKKSQ